MLDDGLAQFVLGPLCASMHASIGAGVKKNCEKIL